MKTGRNAWLTWLAGGLLAPGLAACSQQDQGGTVPQVEDKSFPVTPGTATVKAAFLTGELQDLRVTERVEKGSGKVVDPPKLRGTLKLKNTSGNQAARLIAEVSGGRVARGPDFRVDVFRELRPLFPGELELGDVPTDPIELR